MILRHLRGILYGKPFLASLDRSGMRDDREHCAYIREGDAHCDLPDGYRAYIIESLPEESERVAVAAEHPDASFLFGVEDTAAGAFRPDIHKFMFILYNDRTIIEELKNIFLSNYKGLFASTDRTDTGRHTVSYHNRRRTHTDEMGPV